MESLVEAMAAAYDELVDAAARGVREPGSAAALEELKRRVDAFRESCDRAEVLVQDAAASLGPVPPAAHGLDKLCRTVKAIERDLLQAAAGDEGDEIKDKKKVEITQEVIQGIEEKKDRLPSPPPPLPLPAPAPAEEEK
ncbi:hypothetical protein BRADI_3g60480v3 [Brachypodium distachyon]|uniref:Uncharacterized protein n=1 Tax=Brachypodium distachyon TaxID=15368 RepID=A0A2K2D645_BRADI|nr:hypothetical protein BRADI_3g60480v3 [Brachypodium distachyon]